MELDVFTLSYLETALWASTDDNGGPLEDKYGIDDIALESLKTIVDDCKAFQEDNQSLLTSRHLLKRSCPLSQAGHDFFLTRNGHGAGFWDGDWKDDAGKILTGSSKVYGSQDIYIGDDGKLHVS
jgi:hypothetical protein